MNKKTRDLILKIFAVVGIVGMLLSTMAGGLLALL